MGLWWTEKGVRRASRQLAFAAMLAPLVGVTACAPSSTPPRPREAMHGAGPVNTPALGTPSPRIASDDRPIPRGGGTYKIGQPYQIAGRWYTPRLDPHYDRAGIASWYGEQFHGRRTANGEIYDMRALTAAHPTLPLPSYVVVTSLDNGRSMLVRVNDRGPYAHDRIIDLSWATARLLGLERQGTARVRVRYAGPAPLDGHDARERTFLAAQPWAAQPWSSTRTAQSTSAPRLLVPPTLVRRGDRNVRPSRWPYALGAAAAE